MSALLKFPPPLLPSPIYALRPAMADVTRKLPVELLADILERVSVPDVLKFRQVKHNHSRETY